MAFSVMTISLWGLWAFLPKIATRYISPPSAMIYEVMAGALMAVIIWKRVGPGITLKQRASVYAFGNGIIGYAGVLFYLYAISKQDTILVAPLSASFPIMTLVLGVIFLKERFSVANYAGILMAFVAIYLVLS